MKAIRDVRHYEEVEGYSRHVRICYMTSSRFRRDATILSRQCPLRRIKISHGSIRTRLEHSTHPCNTQKACSE